MPTLESDETLTIDLREVFDGEVVEIRVDGELVRIERDVRTRMQTGLARSIRLHLPPRPCSVEVAVPERDLCERVALDPASTPHLGVEITSDGALRLTQQGEPFRYL